MADEADIVIHSNLTMKKIPTKKLPPSPTADILKNPEKKASTKQMVNKALKDLKTRKGTSLYAIKRYIEDNYHVNADKISHFIKKYLKAAVDAGTIVQTKGIGASGSFKLATFKDKMEKDKDLKKKAKKKTKPSEKEETKAAKENKKNVSKDKKDDTKKTKSKNANTKKVEVTKKLDKKKEKVVKIDKGVKSKPVSAKQKKAKEKMLVTQTPAKKRAAIIKRKSLGSIIKPPKMKPKINK